MFDPFVVFSSEMAFSRPVSPPYTLWTVNDVVFCTKNSIIDCSNCKLSPAQSKDFLPSKTRF